MSRTPSLRLLTGLLPMILSTMTVHGAGSHLVVEHGSGRILLTRNQSQPRQVASLTKIAAVIVALEWCAVASVDPAEWTFTVPDAAIRGGANPLALRGGDLLSLRTALFAAMMASDNTSTHAFAEAIGRRLVPETPDGGGVPVFVEKMNALAARLGMDDTRFVNPHGLDEGAAKGVSTAADLGKLALAAIDTPGFLDYGAGKEIVVPFQRHGGKVEVRLVNTNELVGSRGVDGMKTGTTRLSGPCLVATATRPAPGGAAGAAGREERLIVVVLDAEDRFREAVLLLHEGWARLDAGGGDGAKERLRKGAD